MAHPGYAYWKSLTWRLILIFNTEGGSGAEKRKNRPELLLEDGIGEDIARGDID